MEEGKGCVFCRNTVDRCIVYCQLYCRWVDVQSGTSHSDESMGSGSSSSEKTKVLLERMKMLETEKTCLVLENERQCDQYEKCLDDITSQVLQAVMAQRVTNTCPCLVLYHMIPTYIITNAVF